MDKITQLTWQKSKHFIAKNSDGCEIHLDGAKEIGGTGAGMRPMQLLASSLAGCSAMDFCVMLDKANINYQALEIDVQGDRDETAIPKVFTSLLLIFKLKGKDLNAKTIDRMADLAVNKYCSVGKMLKPQVDIQYKIDLESTE